MRPCVLGRVDPALLAFPGGGTKPQGLELTFLVQLVSLVPRRLTVQVMTIPIPTVI
jgi:hypothetical protein